MPRTRNGGTQTNAEHMGKIRSALRHLSRFWKPIENVRKSVKVGKGKNAKYFCQMCNKLVDKVEIDHITPAGSLKSYSDLPEFCERLFVEDTTLLRALCNDCHTQITQNGRK